MITPREGVVSYELLVTNYELRITNVTFKSMSSEE